jgi:UDP-2,3-diacylglucosamine hydrolase
MSAMSDTQRQAVVFVADSHFHLRPDQAENRRRDRFCQLCRLAEGAGHLVLLGDIFDFWFDYPHFRLRGYEDILQALDAAHTAGTVIHFVGGNHDVWAAAYMQERYGCGVRPLRSALTAGGRRVHLIHGDGMFKLDWAYSAFRALVRARAGIVLAKSLHPEILFALSTWLSGRSRCATRDEAAVIESRASTWLRAQAPPSPSPSDWDLMVIGHVHHGFAVSERGRTLAALPGWLDPLGYGLLSAGRLRLLDFDRDPVPRLDIDAD